MSYFCFFSDKLSKYCSCSNALVITSPELETVFQQQEQGLKFIKSWMTSLSYFISKTFLEALSPQTPQTHMKWHMTICFVHWTSHSEHISDWCKDKTKDVRCSYFLCSAHTFRNLTWTSDWYLLCSDQIHPHGKCENMCYQGDCYNKVSKQFKDFLNFLNTLFCFFLLSQYYGKLQLLWSK